jgi:hypothetical protein
MVGEQGRLRVDGLRAHAGRGVLAALVVAAACAPVATANNGNDHGNGAGPKTPAAEGQGNGAAHGQNATAHENRGQGQRAHGEGRRAHGESQTRQSEPKRAPSQSNEGERHGNGTDDGRKHGQSSEAATGNRGAAHQKTTICHATGSDSNPFVQITISDRALPAHRRHQNGEDIIPAPAGGCPGNAVIAATTAAAAEHAFAGTPPTTAPAATATETPAAPGAPTAPAAGNTVAGATESETPLQHEVRGVVESNDEPAAGGAVSPAAASTGAGDDGSTGPLPFTGLELALLCLAGALLAAAGIALRRSVAARA